MKIPEELQQMYNLCLEKSARGIEKLSVSPEYIMALMERIADLELELAKHK